MFGYGGYPYGYPFFYGHGNQVGNGFGGHGGNGCGCSCHMFGNPGYGGFGSCGRDHIILMPYYLPVASCPHLPWPWQNK